VEQSQNDDFFEMDMLKDTSYNILNSLDLKNSIIKQNYNAISSLSCENEKKKLQSQEQLVGNNNLVIKESSQTFCE
ncbi:8400_t:CDS:2, partial [Funneliformis geosporum]